MALSIEGVSAETVYQEAVNSGLSEVDAAILVSGWIFENFGKTKRTFGYKEPFAEQDANCVADFDRTFSHTDWIDGESVVQAETSAGEDGFNLRFHSIEGDFDGLRADMVKAFNCIASMRAAISKRFDEIRAELNRLNSDVFECCKSDSPGGIVPGTLSPQFNGLVNSGMYLGNVRMNDRDVALWQTQQGYLMLPTVYSIGTDFIWDPRVQSAGRVARHFNESPEIQQRFDGPVSKADLVRGFGTQTLAGGGTLRQHLEILPTDSKYESLDALVDDLAAREAAALRSRSGAGAAAANAFGLDAELESISKAPVERLGFVPHNARVALSRAGVQSMGALAAEDPRRLQAKLKQTGFDASGGDIAEWTATAKTLSSIR